MSWNVAIARRRQLGSIWCEQCGYLPKGKTREAVRQHVDRTGHVAHYVVEEITTYRRKTEEESRG